MKVKYIVSFTETKIRKIDVEVEVEWKPNELEPKFEAAAAARSKLYTMGPDHSDWTEWSSSGTSLSGMHRL